MKGNPKFKLGDKVTFTLDLKEGSITKTGTVYIIDKYGTFEDNSDVSYDIMTDEPCLWKHIREDKIHD